MVKPTPTTNHLPIKHGYLIRQRRAFVCSEMGDAIAIGHGAHFKVSGIGRFAHAAEVSGYSRGDLGTRLREMICDDINMDLHLARRVELRMPFRVHRKTVFSHTKSLGIHGMQQPSTRSTWTWPGVPPTC